MGGIRYTRDEQIAKFEKVEDIRFFYSQDFLNNSGKTKDTDEYYSEIAAEWIIEHLERFKQIPSIQRKSTYYRDTHDGKPKKSDKSWEVRIALSMFDQGIIPGVGRILDYQTPLNDKRRDGAGRIDLLAFDQNNNVLRILELKRPDNDESMLRCVLEAYSYTKLVDREKLILDFNRDGNFNIPEGTPIVACPLVFRNSVQHKELQEMQEGLRKHLKKLIEQLEVRPMIIEENETIYSAYEL